ncbi:MAG: hypothetical protein BM557_11445 [Flavobacterium sp. MedPE-SWcel]|uniref:DUF4294 domain-containing protein n=1 Tax=uncultured Flavobacterium sp. TaxID=165435 RepID=UPI00091AF191|nr:DUF4294 domain-containing protein [uncultured Flavobacterium sp.]OIQ15400.1 MAG: hypothetical protein BM557_11445 [Flavobacterium sp. MedPE-SWcel]
MKVRLLFFFLFLCTATVQSQEIIIDTIKNGIENDSIVFNVEMEEVVISNVKDTVSALERKRLLRLRRRVLKVYPYAKAAAERLTLLNTTMAKLKTKREKRRYAKIVEKYLEEEFEGRLKKLSRKDGQILVKLIHRQTGKSTFHLIKEHKSGWKAFWSNKIAKMFSIDLKTTYSPATVPEDYLIEGFLLKAFKQHRLRKQDPAFEIDYVAITKKWKQKD